MPVSRKRGFWLPCNSSEPKFVGVQATLLTSSTIFLTLKLMKSSSAIETKGEVPRGSDGSLVHVKADKETIDAG